MNTPNNERRFFLKNHFIKIIKDRKVWKAQEKACVRPPKAYTREVHMQKICIFKSRKAKSYTQQEKVCY